MATIANLVARLTADPTGFVAGMGAADGALTGFMTKSTLVKGGLLGIGTVALVVGKQAFDMGLAWDEALDTIQTQTGATGDELEALGQSTLNVYTRIPAELQTVAEAISLINSRLDLTGPVLETVTAQLVELSRITGTDLTGNINAVADAMLKWNVPAAEIPGHIDALFRASQATGVPLERLAQLVADNGAAMSILGFTLPETIALIAAMEGAGINTEMAMRGLRTAIGKLADEGVTDARQGLQDLFTSIKDAPSDMEGTAIAIDYFGQRAGPELARAIRDGSMSLDEMLNIVANGEGTILGTAESTNDFAEKLQILQNKANALLIPLGTLLVDALTWLADQLLVVADGLSTAKGWFDQLPGPVQTVINTFLMLVNPITRITELIDLHKAAWERLQGPINTVVGVIRGALATLMTVFSEVVAGIGSAKDTALAHLSALMTGAITFVAVMWNSIKGQFEAIKATIVDNVSAAKDDAIAAFESLKTSVIVKITNLWSSVTAQMEAIKTTISTKLSEAKTAAVAAITSMTQSMGAQLAGFASTASGLAYSIGAAIVNGIKSGISNLASGAIAAAQSLVDSVLGILSNIPGFSPIEHATAYYGAKAAQGFADGIASLEHRVANSSQNIVDAAMKPLNVQSSSEMGAAVNGRGGAPVIIITPDPEKWVQYMRDAKAGGDFARNFGHELGLYAGQP